jgi:cytochrome c oxidase cbb3-type subunit 3
MAEENKNKKEIDKHSGVETTGHEWDGLKELNNPAPRWWMWVFLATVIWAFGYWVVYPAWPTLTGHTEGNLGWTQYKKLEGEQAEILARKEKYVSKIDSSSLQEIRNSSEVFEFARQAGESLFKDNCATCHQIGGAGAKGYPNLNDDDWIWGGTLEEIKTTLNHGIRAGDENTRVSAMPAFGKDGILQQADINKVTQYVLSLSGKNTDTNQDKIASGKQIYADNCVSCHGEKGEGNKDVGAPNLSDAIWLKAEGAEEIAGFISNPKMGVMPNWAGRLNDSQIKMLTIYVHSLGGGK